jgi:hypothetical protein
MALIMDRIGVGGAGIGGAGNILDAKAPIADINRQGCHVSDGPLSDSRTAT